MRLAIDTAKAHAGRIRVLSVVDAAEIRADRGGRASRGDPPGAARGRRGPQADDGRGDGRRRRGGAAMRRGGHPRPGRGRGGGARAGAGGGGRVERPARLGDGVPLRPRPRGRVGAARPLGDAGGGDPGSALRRSRTVTCARSSPAAGAGPGPSARWGRWPGSPCGRRPPGGSSSPWTTPRKADRSGSPPRGEILADAGYPAWEEKVLPGPPAPTFLSFCDSVAADVVVLGGWGEHRWDDLLGLSITGRLLEDGRRHLFIYM